MKPNIVWITLDSVRQDHTTMDGYERDTTPYIQQLADASDGVAFSRCIAHARASATSIPSMLSGTYPSRHGTYYGNSTAFPDELPLAAELFADEGYTTLGISNNGYASSLTGLDRGFDEFELLGSTPIEILKSAGVWTLLKFLRNIRSHSVGFNTDFHAHSGAYLLTQIAKRMLDRASEPHFTYLHYNEPHRAYYPPLPFLDRYTDELSMDGREAAAISMEIHHTLVERIANGSDLTAEENAALQAMYDAEIAYTDERVAEIVEFVDENFGETILVITADHGELFGEDGMLAHKYSMHNAVLNVPMVVRGLPGLSDDGVIQHADILRTLLEVAGADTDSVQGVDLRDERREFAISQSPPETLEPLLEHNPDFDAGRIPTEAYSVLQDEKFKYVQRPESPALYRLPDETANGTDTYPTVAEELDSFLTDWLKTTGQPVGRGDEVSVDESMRSRLADLGYLDHEM